MSTSTQGPLRRLGAIVGTIALAFVGITATGSAAGAAEGPSIDPDTTGTLTVHKLASPDGDPDLPNDGTEIDADDLDLTPLNGVEFTVWKVDGIDLTTAEGWNAAEELADDVAAGEGVGDYTLEEVDSGLTAAGTVAFADLELGVYFVEETGPGENRIVSKSVEFIVTIPLPTTTAQGSTWLYDVHVYPKNAIGSIEKSVDDSEAHALGDTVSFGIDAEVPSFYGTDGLHSYSIVDELDSRLAYTAGSAVVTLTDNEGADVALDEDDYTVAFADGVLTVEFTAAGLAKLEDAPSGTVHVAFDTTVVSIGNGTITNEASTFINDHEVTSNTVETKWGAVKIFKHDSETPTMGLEGAVFQVFLTETGGTPLSVAGETDFETGADGHVLIPGLKAGTYWIDEITAPERYLPTDGRISIAVTAGSTEQAKVVKVANTRIPDMELPMTGGDGTGLFILGGGALVLIAVGLMMTGRRRSTRN